MREQLNDEQTRVFHAIADPSRLQEQAIRWFGAAVLFKGPAQHFVKRSAQLAIAYDDSPLNHADGRGGSGINAGERAPDAVVVEADGLETTSLFEAIYGERWTLLLFDGERENIRHAIAKAAEVLAPWPQVALRPVLAVPRPDVSVLMAGSLLDIDRFAHQAYRIERPAFVLVRPDGYVAFRGAAREAAQLGDYCRRHLTPEASIDALRAASVGWGRETAAHLCQ